MLPMQGAWVPSLVRAIQIPHATTKDRPHAAAIRTDDPACSNQDPVQPKKKKIIIMEIMRPPLLGSFSGPEPGGTESMIRK